mgnify:CR=1 FL=1
MHDSQWPTGPLSGLSPEAQERFRTSMEAATKASPPQAPSNGRGGTEAPAVDPLDRYRIHPAWWTGWQPITKDCANCAQRSWNWLERWLNGPDPRLPRLPFPRTRKVIFWCSAWLATRPDRTVKLWTALTGGLVDQDAYDKRQATCGPCPDRVIHLRLLKGSMREKSYCGACYCPKWWLARLDIKNRLRGWRCPKRRHVGSDPDAVYRVYALGKAAEARGAATSDAGSTGNGG